jgi:hypothetical protein
MAPKINLPDRDWSDPNRRRAVFFGEFGGKLYMLMPRPLRSIGARTPAARSAAVSSPPVAQTAHRTWRRRSALLTLFGQRSAKIVVLGLERGSV